MAPKPKQTKSKIAAAASAGGKAKKKWTKGKQKEKLNHLVLFDQEKVDRLRAEVPKMKLITPFVISERLKISASLARVAIRELAQEGVIRCVGEAHSKLMIYTRNT
eukprot:Lankesteria_metandrocarpae@DN4325_c0_g1_i1.p1